jgi:hypothetical protein
MYICRRKIAFFDADSLDEFFHEFVPDALNIAASGQSKFLLTVAQVSIANRF